MPSTLSEQFRQELPPLKPNDPRYVPAVVDALLSAARRQGASDVHLLPTETALEMHWRIDGVLQPVAEFPREVRGNIVGRLKVLAELLTYQTDLPQEGRIRVGEGDVEMRVSTFPTLHGEKGVVRLFVGSGRYRLLDELGFPADVLATLKGSDKTGTGSRLPLESPAGDQLGEKKGTGTVEGVSSTDQGDRTTEPVPFFSPPRGLLHETGGTILVTGPAGSGKTTTVYAALRELTDGTRSLVTLEDPIEAVLPGVAQSQVRPAAGFDYATGLKSLMRQDPEVILVGEIRDRDTAETVFQAALTGHLVLTTFHAGSAAEAVGRLLDMGLEPYQLRSGVLCVLNQRLVRRLCACAEIDDDPAARLGLAVERAYRPVGCETCHGTGYRDRIALVEMLVPEAHQTGRAILSRSESREIERRAVAAGMRTRWDRAAAAIESGLTTPAEVRRVWGFR